MFCYSKKTYFNCKKNLIHTNLTSLFPPSRFPLAPPGRLPELPDAPAEPQSVQPGHDPAGPGPPKRAPKPTNLAPGHVRDVAAPPSNGRPQPDASVPAPPHQQPPEPRPEPFDGAAPYGGTTRSPTSSSNGGEPALQPGIKRST